MFLSRADDSFLRCEMFPATESKVLPNKKVEIPKSAHPRGLLIYPLHKKTRSDPLGASSSNSLGADTAVPKDARKNNMEFDAALSFHNTSEGMHMKDLWCSDHSFGLHWII